MRRKKVRNIIWDYRSGYVIDVDTGEVLDRIYDYTPLPPPDDQ